VSGWWQDLDVRAARAIDDALEATALGLAPLFDAITAVVRTVLGLLENVFVGLPWPVIAIVVVAAGWRAGGWRLGLFVCGSLAYLGLFGFWEAAMSTLSLVAAAVAVCFVLGLPIGVLCAKSERLWRVVRPLLDVMQTMPSFVYLVPAIALFSIGKPPAVLATVVFALPPMIRLTQFGVATVAEDVKEAALAFGATPRQLLLKVELPLAARSIRNGLNQSVMMSLSMVVIAALIGAGGLGYDVLYSLQRVEAGKGILAGIAIVLCAMMLDRIIEGASTADDEAAGR
jgi:glycine betaine/proline transport system permease protein